MNKRIILGILLFAVSICACGCSLMEPVSDKDMDAIASYSAKMVAKYNTKQKDGVVYIDGADELNVAKEDLEKASTATKSSTNSTQQATNSSAGNTTQTSTPVPLSTALGITGAQIAYQGVEVKDNYTTSIFDMSPTTGNKFLVMKFKLTNTGSADANVDILSLNPKFKATINGGATANNEITLMPEDLSTFKGTLKANESKDLIVLFQFNAGDLSNIQGTSLKCTVKGSTNDITL